MLQLIKKMIETAFHCRIYRYSLPRGVNLAYDINPIIGIGSVSTIFDVGANIGQSILKFRQDFNNAKMYCFEPVSTTFQILVQKFRDMPSIELINEGLGEKKGISSIYLEDSPFSSENSIIDKNDPSNKNKEVISMNTVDNYCDDNNINKIDILKVDTEGYDLYVLKGAERMLREHRISILYLETELRKSNNIFISLNQFDSYLKDKGYSIFGIYEQTPDIKKRKSHLYFCNVAYICNQYDCR